VSDEPLLVSDESLIVPMHTQVSTHSPRQSRLAMKARALGGSSGGRGPSTGERSRLRAPMAAPIAPSRFAEPELPVPPAPSAAAHGSECSSNTFVFSSNQPKSPHTIKTMCKFLKELIPKTIRAIDER
jgi:hypothetical protein